jgi:hypothetical protein
MSPDKLSKVPLDSLSGRTGTGATPQFGLFRSMSSRLFLRAAEKGALKIVGPL